MRLEFHSIHLLRDLGFGFRRLGFTVEGWGKDFAKEATIQQVAQSPGMGAFNLLQLPGCGACTYHLHAES